MKNRGCQMIWAPNKLSFMPECRGGEIMAWTVSSILSAGLTQCPIALSCYNPLLVSSLLRQWGQLGQGKTVSCFTRRYLLPIHKARLSFQLMLQIVIVSWYGWWGYWMSGQAYECMARHFLTQALFYKILAWTGSAFWTKVKFHRLVLILRAVPGLTI